ncbi:capsular polysaccharide synthesis protein [Clostridium perfringens]|uniref:capsular polysaccharide synthesis protein n=1 Tax=Clostridium perfringens TaxID=1502 RepID=UPI003AF8F0B5
MFIRKFKKKLSYIFNYGFEVSIYIILNKIFSKKQNKIYNYFLIKKHNSILKYLKKKYKYFINEYKNEKDINNYKENTSMPIWSFWWQGEENAPAINQICFKSIKKFSNGHPVIIISKDNIKDYIDIPDFVINKFQKGIISITHFSDIVRFKLLNRYGGIWVDASIYLSNNIEEDIFNYEFFTAKVNGFNTSCISKGRWVIGLIGGKSNNILLDFLDKFHYEYWKNENELIDYFLCDYMIQIALEEIPYIQELLKKILQDNNHIFDMRSHLNDKFDIDIYNAYIKNSNFHSFQRRNKYIKFNNNQITNYGYLYKEFIN